jgi:urocanate hydratase
MEGMRFWDYGNAFLLEASRADADIWSANDHTTFRYPSYFEDFMGDIFALGFGPFRCTSPSLDCTHNVGVCTSGKHEDLQATDTIAQDVIKTLMKQPLDARVEQQYRDNLDWITAVESHQLVVGSEARILYSNAQVHHPS